MYLTSLIAGAFIVTKKISHQRAGCFLGATTIEIMKTHLDALIIILVGLMATLSSLVASQSMVGDQVCVEGYAMVRYYLCASF
jgi:hypothetical protein